MSEGPTPEFLAGLKEVHDYVPWTDSQVTAMADTIGQLERAWFKPSDVAGSDGTYGYISYPLVNFLRGLRQARDRVDYEGLVPNFLEVGCAWGTKMMLAYWLGWNPSGLEMVPEYVDSARELFKERRDIVGRTWKGNVEDEGLVDELLDYTAPSCVYMYRPVMDEKRMQKILFHFGDTLPAHTVMFTPECPIPKGVEVLDDVKGIWLT